MHKLSHSVPYHQARTSQQISDSLSDRTGTAHLVPADEQLPVRVPEESSDVRTAESHAGHGEGETHGDGRGEVTPVRGVVPGPDCRVPLRPGIRGSRQHERSAGHQSNKRTRRTNQRF